MAGYFIAQNPITAQNVMFNILAPGVVENQIIFGFSIDIAKNHEISLTFMYTFENSVIGANPL